MLIEPLGSMWAVFGPLSGDSHVLNDEAVAMLEALPDGIERDELSITTAIAAEFAVPVNEVASLAHETWATLLAAGLIRECAPIPTSPS